MKKISEYYHTKMTALLLPVLLLVLGGCAIDGIRAEKIYSVKEAFSLNGVRPNIKKLSEPLNYVRRVFSVPYSDVFQAANTAATQAMFDVEAFDEKNGLIWASVRQSGYPRWRHLFEVRVNEVDARKTEVIFLKKFQADSTDIFSGKHALFPNWMSDKTWPLARSYSSGYPSKFFKFLRLNLINAGLI